MENIQLVSNEMKARYMTKNKKKYHCNRQEREERKMEKNKENAKTKKKKEIFLAMAAFLVLGFSGSNFFKNIFSYPHSFQFVW